jgi:pyruvate/oxaloacetate carboxyltransferase
VPDLVDTTIRLLSQEPLAERVSAAGIYDLVEELDGAGFACLEISGGGCFDSAVRLGVESPWERIRAIRARCETPLGMALRGRFLVGSRPVSGDLVRRFIASAAASGIDVFRIHDPLNDLGNLGEAAGAIRDAGKELSVGLVHSPGPSGEVEVLLERAQHLPKLGAARVLIHDPASSLDPAKARALVERVGGRAACRWDSTAREREGQRSPRRSRRCAPAPRPSPAPCTRWRSRSTASPPSR